jgi:hypothetical protein
MMAKTSDATDMAETYREVRVRRRRRPLPGSFQSDLNMRGSFFERFDDAIP